MATWLAVAAERREFDGILRRFGVARKFAWPAAFAREAEWRGDRWLLIANGPGAGAVERALEKKIEVNGIVSTGFCGGLDPVLKVGDIVRESIFSADRVAITSAEKKAMREKTGAAAVDMESAALAKIAANWGVPFFCIRAVSDTSNEDMPLDFNRYRLGDGGFSRRRIAFAALARPFTAIPGLIRLDRNCQIAAESLGEYFADCKL
ncbi:MAG: hypothetical protein ACRD30_08660 [Bryobacteraceae bacterium]